MVGYTEVIQKTAFGDVTGDVPSRNEARTGLRMMPTFPRSPKFPKAGFTRYGFNPPSAGLFLLLSPRDMTVSAGGSLTRTELLTSDNYYFTIVRNDQEL